MIVHKRAILAVLGKLRVPKNTLDLYGDWGRVYAVLKLDSNEESSFKGHRVDALVLTGDEGRDKLR